MTTDALILDFHGVVADSLFGSPAMAGLLDDKAITARRRELETGVIGVGKFLSLLPATGEAADDGQQPFSLNVRHTVLDRVRSLREAGMPVALLTNSFRGLRAMRRSAGVSDDLFDVVVESWIVGAAKPDAAMYTTVVERLAVPPDHCLFLDDEILNVQGARSAGLVAVHVTTEKDVIGTLDVLLESLRN